MIWRKHSTFVHILWFFCQSFWFDIYQYSAFVFTISSSTKVKLQPRTSTGQDVRITDQSFGQSLPSFEYRRKVESRCSSTRLVSDIFARNLRHVSVIGGPRQPTWTIFYQHIVSNISFLSCRRNLTCHHVNPHVPTQCEQEYALQQLMVFSPEFGVHVDQIKIPLGCKCSVVKQPSPSSIPSHPDGQLYSSRIARWDFCMIRHRQSNCY